MTKRLGEDHANARHLAEGLAALDGFEVDLEDVHINMVWFKLPAGLEVADVTSALAAIGVKASPPYGGRMRLMTHWQVSRADVDRVLVALRALTRGEK